MWQQIEKKSEMLDKAIKDLANNGYDLAEKEKKYKTAVSQKALELRANDTPVTLINQIIYGYKEIADLRFDRDVAEVKYNSNLEYINVIKLQIRLLENQLSREWGNAK
jgi:hypothetical protein